MITEHLQTEVLYIYTKPHLPKGIETATDLISYSIADFESQGYDKSKICSIEFKQALANKPSDVPYHQFTNYAVSISFTE